MGPVSGCIPGLFIRNYAGEISTFRDVTLPFTCRIQQAGERYVYVSFVTSSLHSEIWNNKQRLGKMTSGAAPKLKRLVAGFPPRRPGFKNESKHVGFVWWTKWRWGRFSPSTSVSPANLYSTNISTITITNHPGLVQ
jgi:hypothetical protein